MKTPTSGKVWRDKEQGGAVSFNPAPCISPTSGKVLALDEQGGAVSFNPASCISPSSGKVWALDEQGGTPPCISPTSGKVWLIGAGPGDVELLTLKAVRALGEADVALVDELVNREVLQFLKPGTRIVEVGKRGGCKSTPQDFIERQMLRYARQGLTVARIKGGDPYVFGRGGEEADTLRQAGIAVEVVNGITSGIAAPASLGIPVTHRDCSRGVTLVTGHTSRENANGKGPNWAALAHSGTTLVIYMGMSHLAEIAAALRAAGMHGDTPVALIQNGTLATERSVVTSLSSASEAARTSGIRSPAIIVVGDVVRFANQALVQASEAPRQVA